MDHSPNPGRPVERSRDSVASNDTAMSRESILSMSSKLLNMESELDKTLRDLEVVSGGSKPHSKSPSAGRRRGSGSTRASARQSGSANSSRRRSESIDPLASSRRSDSIDPLVRVDHDLRVRDLTERLEHVEKENQLLDTKYSQQRKRLNLAKRENDDLRSTLDAAIAEIGKLGEEAKASHKSGGGGEEEGVDSKLLAGQVASLTAELALARAHVARLDDAEAATRAKALQDSAAADSLSEAVQGHTQTLPLSFPPPPLAETLTTLTSSVPAAPPFSAQNEEGCTLVVSLGAARNLASLLPPGTANSRLEVVVRYGGAERRVAALSPFAAPGDSADRGDGPKQTAVLFPLTRDATSLSLSLSEVGSEQESVLASATLELPDYPTAALGVAANPGTETATSVACEAEAPANACLELDEWVALKDPSAAAILNSPLSPQGLEPPALRVSLACVNLCRLPSDLATLEMLKRRVQTDEAAAAESEAAAVEEEAGARSLRTSLDGGAAGSAPPGEHASATDNSDCLLNSHSVSSSISLFSGDGPPTPPTTRGGGNYPSPTENAAAAAAASDPESDHPKSAAADGSEAQASSAAPTTRPQRKGSAARARMLGVSFVKLHAKRRPLAAALATCVALLFCYVGVMETLHSNKTRRVQAKMAAVELEYERACAAFGLDPAAAPAALTGLGGAAEEAAAQLLNCTVKSAALEANATLFGRCSRDLEAERSVSEQLLAEIHSRDATSGGGDRGEGGEVSEGGAAAVGAGWWGGSKNSDDARKKSEAAGDPGPPSVTAQAGTAAALYQCRREHGQEASSRMGAVMKLEASEQEGHACAQEKSRLGAAHDASVAEHGACEARLLKQDAWAASLAATNNVVQGHLRDSSSELSSLQGSHATWREEAARCEAALESVGKAKAVADASVAALSKRTAALENGTATLTGQVGVLEAQLGASQRSSDAFAGDKDALEGALQEANAALDALTRDKQLLEGSRKAADAKVKDLAASLKDGEKRLRAFALAGASTDARQEVLERRAAEQESAASTAKGSEARVSARNGELASQLGLALSSKGALEAELASKASRLNDLETVVASLKAAERVVSRGKEGSHIETCTDGSGSGKRLCLKVETAPMITRAAAAAAGMAKSAWDSTAGARGGAGGGTRGEETPGLVAIAGAVAAVWVFAVVMEKRKALYQQNRR